MWKDDEWRSRWSWHPTLLADPGAVVRAREVERRDTPEVHERPKRQASGALLTVPLLSGCGARAKMAIIFAGVVGQLIFMYGSLASLKLVKNLAVGWTPKVQVTLWIALELFAVTWFLLPAGVRSAGHTTQRWACDTSHHTGYSFSVSLSTMSAMTMASAVAVKAQRVGEFVALPAKLGGVQLNSKSVQMRAVRVRLSTLSRPQSESGHDLACPKT